jgi:hypothetical protein
MAKDLPYFKFFCSEWSDGDITLEELHVQGLFINVCAYYWSKECNLSVDKLMKKFQNHPLNLLETLFSEGIIKQVKGMVKISFLDEQYGERNNLCNQNSINAKKGWEKRKKIKNISDRNATASNPQCESNAKGMQYREEERREEKKREEKKKEDDKEKCDNVYDFSILDVQEFKDVRELKNYYLNNLRLMNALCDNKKNRIKFDDLPKRLEQFTTELESSGRFKETFTEYSQYFRNWVRKVPHVQKNKLDNKGRIIANFSNPIL